MGTFEEFVRQKCHIHSELNSSYTGDAKLLGVWSGEQFEPFGPKEGNWILKAENVVTYS